MIINTLNGADGRADLRQAESLELVRCPISETKKLPFGSFILYFGADDGTRTHNNLLGRQEL